MHVLRCKTGQLLLLLSVVTWRKLSCVVGSLLFLFDTAWLSAVFSLTGIMLDGCGFCERSLLSGECLTSHLLDTAGLCGATGLYCVAQLGRALLGSTPSSLYSQIPNKTTDSGEVPREPATMVVFSKPRVAQSSGRRCLRVVIIVLLISQQIFSMSYIFGLFPSNF